MVDPSPHKQTLMDRTKYFKCTSMIVSWLILMLSAVIFECRDYTVVPSGYMYISVFNNLDRLNDL